MPRKIIRVFIGEGRRGDSPIWLAVLSDLMTNLMLFFLVMYSFTRAPEDDRLLRIQAFMEKFERKPAEPMTLRERQVVKTQMEAEAAIEFGQILQKYGISEEATVHVTEKKINIRMNLPLLFGPGEDRLTPQAEKILTSFAQALKELPNTVVVEGHTDNAPLSRSKNRFGSNWELSIARATSVIDLFTKRYRLPENRFVAAGYGEFHPLAPNETEEGRARNRRIEISILREGFLLIPKKI